MTSIRAADVNDIAMLYQLYGSIGKKDDGYFEHALEQGIAIYLCFDGERPVGFCLLNWTPRYSLYHKLDIPEIQDLNVLPSARRKGFATSLIKWCEGIARANGKQHIGISVGLTKDYGPAQILYTRLGYVPDGNGITYDRHGVQFGQSYPADDNLALMMIKPL
jgi:GNAT superfamily N-acetyltransferase